MATTWWRPAAYIPSIRLLDTEHGRCRVYEARPIACRTYGYYVHRDQELVCEKVEEFAKERPVVWGNHEAIDVRLERVAGRTRSLRFE